MKTESRQAASFRDPSGFLYWKDGELYRQIQEVYRPHYDHLMQSGLYTRLAQRGMLLEHAELSPPGAPTGSALTIKPEVLPFISYPFEWSFSQLKDAALLTLELQLLALEASMTLKDASAYNIQFRLRDGRPVLIDSLSFERYQEGRPWEAYRQFCQHFLAPLALMAHTDIRLSQLLRVYIDGVPLDLASRLLPRKTRLNFGLLAHVHAHASAQRRLSRPQAGGAARRISKLHLQGLVDNLKRTVAGLAWKPERTDWSDYYAETNYADEAMRHKEQLVQGFLRLASPAMVWDLGANTGRFSRLSSQEGFLTVAFDLDQGAVERNYLELKARKDRNLLPLVMDLTNPTPNLGWANRERMSLLQRTKPDLVLALALVHHLAISNNVPLGMLAGYLAEIAPWLIIEFVPKQDSQAQRLLAHRQDIFTDYHPQGFEDAFRGHFRIHKKESIAGTQRVLYVMERVSAAH